jgi:hypothetical protein
LVRSAIVQKPSTILRFHKAVVKRKYRLLFTQKNGRTRSPKGPSLELFSAIVEMKYGKPRFGYQRIADQISLTFDVDLDKDVVRRVLAKHYRSIAWFKRAVLAQLSRSYKRQLMECGSFSVRIVDPQITLGDGHHGSKHAANHRICCSWRHR